VTFIKKFEDVAMGDVALVGGKNASLGEMISQLKNQHIRVPDGFAITADAYWYFIARNNLADKIQNVMATLTDDQDTKQLQLVGKTIRELIENGTLPDDLAQEILHAYHALSREYQQDASDVAVRSSATAEDLPSASFAGQQETYLNVQGDEQLLAAYKKCLASLFTDRAIIYRIETGFANLKIALSVGVQKMIRSDLACSGVAFSLDTETGFPNIVMINGSYGLGESIVQGLVIPDEFIVHKPTLNKGFASIVKKQLGDKQTKMIYRTKYESSVQTVKVDQADKLKFSLTDQEVLELARYVVTIEKHYSNLKGHWTPMDIEWAKDGLDNKLYIIQARPETIHGGNTHKNELTLFHLDYNDKENPLSEKILTVGQSVGQHIVSSPARVIESARDIDQVQKGDVLVTTMTDPDWVPAMKRAAGIVTDQGGRTCHAAIVSRELKIPAIVGTENGTSKIITGQMITLDCAQGKQGYIYQGKIPFKITTVELDGLPQLPADIMVNVADPDGAFSAGMLPVKGVGLARMEFIINNAIKVHPMALVHPERVLDAATRKKIDEITHLYADKKEFFVDALAQGIAMIGAAFYPHPVITRLSDFKTNEYRNLIGGVYFEPEEENPMIGFRGASRYYNDKYREAFALECQALKKVRDEMGLTNIQVMIPFVRTVGELEKVLKEMKKNGLTRGENGLKIIMMCEVPSNVIVIDEFSKLLDGFSIGSNDLTQLTLGVDRDSGILTKEFDERDRAVQKMLKMAVEGARRNNVYIGICGQAPSDYPEIAQSLMDWGINSLSLNPDTVIPFLLRYK
jgi:pyruvate,water dikinase